MDKASEFQLPAAGLQKELLVDGPAGHLQALVSMPKGTSPAGIAVICHPHPLFGGAMTNKVVYSLASCALKAGLATLRFNFRGVGKSTGLYDDSRGETDDALALVAWMKGQVPAVPLTLAGFSFGAYVALKAAAVAKPMRLVTISIPFGRYVDGAEPPPRPECRWLAVHSRDDDVVDFAETDAVLQAYRPPPERLAFEGAGHFYHGRLTELQSAIQGFLDSAPP